MSEALQRFFSKGVDGLVAGLPMVLPAPWDQERAADQSGVPLAPYVIDPSLAAAAWVALLLRQPLFLTGDPGVGKTRFADALAERLGLGRAQRVQVKSETKGRDLLYTFDELARFRDATRAAAKVGSAEPALPLRPDVAYVRLRGLGRAIMRAAGAATTVTLRTGFRREDVVPQHLLSLSEVTLGDLFPEEFAEHRGIPCHSVVLIDEIDKAPRDAPNDLLFEIEAMSFEIEEIGATVSAKPDYKPIVVITSNSERNLPDAFMRRCVFYNMTLPNADTLRKIAAGRLGDGLQPDSALIKDAEAFFSDVSSRITEKKPGTAEFIGLVAFLQKAGLKPENSFGKSSELAHDSLKVLAKTQADLAAAERHLQRRSG
jgi:MoxR-like ATPase